MQGVRVHIDAGLLRSCSAIGNRPVGRVTIVRPDLSPQELVDAREAWALVQRGKPIPTQYRPAAMKVAVYCFARGYDHDDDAGARELFIHPDARREGCPGVFGVNRRWTATQLAAWIEGTTQGTRAKGTGWMLSPGHSKVGDEIAGAHLPPHQRGDEQCRKIGWLFLDADDVGDWTAILDAIRLYGGAFVRGRSGSHCTFTGSCAAHPKGQVKWHLAVPLREAYVPPASVNVARAEWKGELYAVARFAFHLVAEVTGRGFDRQLDQLLGRMYAGAPYDSQHIDISREVAGVEGLGFDIRACSAGLEELGVVDPAEVRAGRVAASLPQGIPWEEADGEPPMIAAFKVDDLYVRPMANGKHAVVCPWTSMHTCGRAGDTSTVLFPNGIFHCSHSHPEGTGPGGVGMREVLARLSPEAQAAHAAASRRGRSRGRSTKATGWHDMNNDEASEVGAVKEGWTPEPRPVEAGAGERLLVLLAELERNPDRALSDPFIRAAACLPAGEQAKLRTEVKKAGVALHSYDAVLKRVTKAAATLRRVQEEHSRREASTDEAATGKVRLRFATDLERMTDESVAALSGHPDVFQRGGVLVQVLRDRSRTAESDQRGGPGDAAEAPRIAVIVPPMLRAFLSAVAVFVDESQRGPMAVPVPYDVVNAVHALGQWKGIRTLKGVVECPMLRPDGTVLDAPGFDPATGLLYIPSEDFSPVPNEPSRVQVDAALARIFDLVADFPFKERWHRSAWLSALLTCLSRFAFAGPSPLNMVDGNAAGVGKGRLVKAIGALVQGRDIGVMVLSEGDDEQRKAITAKAMSGARMALFDNVNGPFGGPALDAALTSMTWEDRLLGTNQTVVLPLLIVFFATGNNIQPRGDLIRRALHIRLETQHHRPEERTDLRHESFDLYVRQHRAAIVNAALTILRGYCVAGRPRQSIPPWGSFEEWSDLIRGAIVWAGEPDPFLTPRLPHPEHSHPSWSKTGAVGGGYGSAVQRCRRQVFSEIHRSRPCRSSRR